MSRSVVIALLVLVGAGLLLAAGDRETMDVQVLNFPDLQKVTGNVTVDGAIRHAEIVRFPDVIVPPVAPTDTTRLIQGGTLTTDGFTGVILSLSGLVKGDVVKAGAVGAFLIPDEEPIQRAFNETGQMQFPLEVEAPHVSGPAAYFASTQTQATVAFPRYRVLLYNTSDKTVTVNLFGYLTN